MDWSSHFPDFIQAESHLSKSVQVADIGCGFGGLIVAMSPVFPTTLMLGMIWDEYI